MGQYHTRVGLCSRLCVCTRGKIVTMKFLISLMLMVAVSTYWMSTTNASRVQEEDDEQILINDLIEEKMPQVEDDFNDDEDGEELDELFDVTPTQLKGMKHKDALRFWYPPNRLGRIPALLRRVRWGR